MHIIRTTRMLPLLLILLVVIPSVFLLKVTPYAYAATTPSLGLAATFGILSSTYTNTVGGTTISGDLGYTTGPAVAPTVSGTTHIADGTYSTAGTDQGSALSVLAAQSCTHTFPAGPVDLATDTSHGPIGVYTPGVYCTTSGSAASIGSGGMTLSGSGTYIFRIDGAFTTVTGSVVTLSGSSACDVFWTPTSATTLGGTTTLAGTVIDDSGITIGSTVTWEGRALAFGGTVSTTSDTITVPTCTAPTATPTPTAAPTSTPTPTSAPGPTATPGPGPTATPGPSSNTSESTASPTSTPSVGRGGIVRTRIPGFPNTGGTTRLPNTGFGPSEQKIPWNIVIPIGILMVITIVRIVIGRKRFMKSTL